MTYRDVALELDSKDSPAEAAWAYEIAICAPGAECDTFLNLVALYLECSDFGYAAGKGLSDAFVNAAAERARDVLGEAEKRFGETTDVCFWRLYTRERIGYEEVPDQEYEELTRQNDSLLPCFRLYVSSGGAKYRDEIRQLLAQVEDGGTARKRHIKSVLESPVLPKP